ncbi:GGDEF domain-containing protein [Paenibacillus sp. J5C_2022]|uniref:GGDEF domain-containing protein n=1 Tax=Paenibacillus sp. J5C2022 TaxID=2977129 RepID=UPI0021D349C7|nr:GGDEF domain-containing protein [Paenibacillus sp. J5C2022]MCU6710466.1 GGDEF domain-containing protein [Paenibacillus sp. J5C2022]
MGAVGSGLWNRELMHTADRHWIGGFATLYLQLRKPNEHTGKALQVWERETDGLFWKQQIGEECYYFVRSAQGDRTMQAIVQEAASRLMRGLGDIAGLRDEDGEGRFRIGTACSASPSPELTMEAVLHGMIMEARAQAAASSPVEEEKRRGSMVMLERGFTIGRLASPIPEFQPHARVSDIAQLFHTRPREQGAAIVSEGTPLGLIMKEKLHQLLAGQFGLPLYYNRPVEKIMESQPLVVDEGMPVEEVSQLAMSREYSDLYDVVLITREERLIGAASIRAILESITALRTEVARTANPLTGLPGNASIHAELAGRMAEKRPFAIIYADLDYFKWFNDCFGFGLGDELIRYLAGLLNDAISRYGEESGFIGHIGGDDFIAMLSPESADRMCEELIERFDNGVKAFYGGVQIAGVEDRNGNTVNQEGVTLSLSVLYCTHEFSQPLEDIAKYAAKLKKRAKLVKGSVYVTEQLSRMGHAHGEERVAP